MENPTPEECYRTLGFAAYDGVEPSVDAVYWRSLQDSKKLEDVRRRTLIRRDQGNHVLVDAGYVVGRVPPLNLSKQDVEKLLSALTEGIARGLQTVSQWQDFRAEQLRKGR